MENTTKSREPGGEIWKLLEPRLFPPAYLELYARYSIFACVHCSRRSSGNKALSLSRNNVPLSICAWNNWLQPSARIAIIDHVCDVCPDIDIESLFNTDEWLPLDGTMEFFFSKARSRYPRLWCLLGQRTRNQAFDLHRLFYWFDTAPWLLLCSSRFSSPMRSMNFRKLSDLRTYRLFFNSSARPRINRLGGFVRANSVWKPLLFCDFRVNFLETLEI